MSLDLQDHQAYLDTHNIKTHVEKVINDVVQSKPAQPLVQMVCLHNYSKYFYFAKYQAILPIGG